MVIIIAVKISKRSKIRTDGQNDSKFCKNTPGAIVIIWRKEGKKM